MRELFFTVLAAVLNALLGRWLRPKNPEVEALHEAVEAKQNEVVAMARPDRDKQRIIDRLRQHD